MSILPEESCIVCSHKAAEDGGLCSTPTWRPPPPRWWCWSPGRCPQSSPTQSSYVGGNMNQYEALKPWWEVDFTWQGDICRPPQIRFWTLMMQLPSWWSWQSPQQASGLKSWVFFCKLLQDFWKVQKHVWFASEVSAIMQQFLRQWQH